MIQNWTYTPAPAAPTGVTVTAASKQATLNWSPVTAATSYIVQYGATSGGPYSTVLSGITGTSDTITNLTSGTTYYFVIYAVNAAGQSVGSAQVVATA
jgi:endoglucanase